jgi:predicted transposase/invertase (TIGR01784 family)
MSKLKNTFLTDILFKSLFVKNRILLQFLIARLLKIPFESITKFEIRNTEMPPETLGKKFCRLDIHMTVNDQEVSLEVQVDDEGNFRERALYYWARLYSDSLPAGGDYGNLPRTIVISIVNFKLFDCMEFHSEYQSLEVTRHTPLTDRKVLHFFELPKLPTDLDESDISLLWLALFKADTEEEIARIEALGVQELNQAISAYRTVSASPEFHELERLRSKALHDEAQALKNAARRGRADGMSDVAKNALQMDMPIADIVKLTGLSQAEVEALRSN